MPILKTDGEPWTGEFPGLGRVEVFTDGTYSVTATARPGAIAHLREDALRYGWAELLAATRLGFSHVHGMSVGLANSNTCLLLLGDPREKDSLLGPLLQEGFAILAPRPAPVRWEDEGLVAHPSIRPVTTSRRRAERLGLPWQRLREDTDAGQVEVPRLVGPRRVAGLLAVGAKRPHDQVFRTVTGHERFELAAGVIMGGRLDPNRQQFETDAPTESNEDLVALTVDRHLKLAALPSARLYLEKGAREKCLQEALPWMKDVLAS